MFTIHLVLQFFIVNKNENCLNIIGITLHEKLQVLFIYINIYIYILAYPDTPFYWNPVKEICYRLYFLLA